MKINKDAVTQKAESHWRDILLHVAGIPDQYLATRHGPCPRCQAGTDRFRCFDDWEQTGGTICSTCAPKGNADGFSTIQWMTGWDFKTTLRAVSEHLGLAVDKDRAKSQRRRSKKPSPGDQIEPKPWSDQLAKHFVHVNHGITVDALRRAGCFYALHQAKAVLVIPAFGSDLENRSGLSVMNMLGKYLPKMSKEGRVVGQVRAKTIFGSSPGLIGQEGVQAIHAHHAEIVWKCEGVTDCLALMSAIPAELRGRHVAITNLCGCGESPKWMSGVLSSVPQVYVVHDQDDPGQRGAERWISEIAVEGGTVANVQLPFEMMATKGKDLRDFLEGHTYQDLLDLASRHKLCGIATNAVADTKDQQGGLPADTDSHPSNLNLDYRRILTDLQLEVLSESSAGDILVYSQHTRKTSTIDGWRTAKMTKVDCIRMCGLPARVAVKDAGDDADDTPGHSITKVREAIGMAASGCRIDQEDFRLLGPGMYSGDGDAVVLCNRSEIARWNGGGNLEKILVPRADGLLFDLGRFDWYDHDQMEELCRQAKDPAWCRSIIDEVVSAINLWTWSRDEDPQLLTGFILATFCQSIWRWRPQVSIRGDSNSGKTVFLQMLFGDRSINESGIFGRLSHRSSHTTSAGLRQSIGQTSFAIGIDEWDSIPRRHRSDILKLLRTAGSGDHLVMGTAHHHAIHFGLRHICWLSGIHCAMDEAADANRFIQFELVAPTSKKDAWRMPAESDRERWGRSLLAIATVHALDAARTAKQVYRQFTGKGIHDRVVESLAVSASILGTAAGLDSDGVSEIVGHFVAIVGACEDDMPGIVHEQMLSDILGVLVDCGSGAKFSVASILLGDNDRLSVEAATQAAEQVGVELRSWNGKDWLVIDTARVSKKVDYEDHAVRQVLRRVAGAVTRPTKFRGRLLRCTWIPVTGNPFLVKLYVSEF